jgi:hypothetical protein
VRLEGYLPRTSVPNSVPLMSWWNPTRTDNFGTTDPSWAALIGGTPQGYRYYRTEGYVLN